jgi:hypothetical protein
MLLAGLVQKRSENGFAEEDGRLVTCRRVRSHFAENALRV